MAATVTIRGILAPLLQATSKIFDPQRGWIYRYEYRGASQYQMELLAQSYANQGMPLSLKLNQGDSASLEVEDPTQSFTIDTWEIVGNEESRDGLGHPTLINSLVGGFVVDDVIEAMRRNLNANVKPSDVFSSSGDLFGAGPVVQLFYSLQVRGSTEYRHGQYVLRHKTNVPNRWNINIADIGIDTIYTTAQLLSETTDASLWIFPLPGRLQYKLGRIASDAIASNPGAANYQWGWLKSASTETTAANNRVDISTEYTFELWTTGYYPPR
jgi:hypothetical protein